eukprot:SAG31_NODE_288_length_18400_cov_55.018851_16_plen_170_part_00
MSAIYPCHADGPRRAQRLQLDAAGHADELRLLLRCPRSDDCLLTCRRRVPATRSKGRCCCAMRSVAVMASAGSRRSQPPTVLSRQSLEIPTSAKAVATAEDRKPRSRTLWEKAAGIARKKRLRSRPPYSRLYTVLFGRVGAHRAAALQKTGASIVPDSNFGHCQLPYGF